MNAFQDAREELVKAFDMCPEDSSNKEVIYAALLAVNFALGQLPDPSLTEQYPSPTEFEDFFASLEYANLQLYERAIKNTSDYFQSRRLLNAMYSGRSQVALSLLVKYYTVHDNNHLIDLSDMAELYRSQLSLSCYDADGDADDVREVDEDQKRIDAGKLLGMEHVLPLISKRDVRGALQDNWLILAKKEPFPAFPQLSSPA